MQILALGHTVSGALLYDWEPSRRRLRATRPIPFLSARGLAIRSSAHGGVRVVGEVDGVARLLQLVDGGHFVDVALPGPNVAARDLGLHRCGRVSILVSGELRVLANGVWSHSTLPDDFSPTSVSFDATGTAWVAGANIAAGKESRVALFRVSTNGDVETEKLSLPVVAGAWARERGGLEVLDSVDAERAPIVAMSACAWFFDDSASFLFARLPSGRWNVKRVADGAGSSLLRHPSGVLLVRADGRVMRVSQRGRLSWLAANPSLDTAIRTALGLPRGWVSSLGAYVRIALDLAERDDAPLVVDIDVTEEGDIVAIVSFAEATMLCVSRDTGRSWEIVELEGEDGEHAGVRLCSLCVRREGAIAIGAAQSFRTAVH